MSETRLQVVALSHEGRGIARHHGKTCFVSGALPDETVLARLVQRRSRLDEYDTCTVETPSLQRVEPVCTLYGRCGGCDFQHLAVDAQRQHKQQSVLDLLARQAGLVPDQVEAPLVSEAWHYRRRARLAIFLPRRGGDPVLGFRERGSQRILPVTECPVLEPALSALLPAAASVLTQLTEPRCLGHLELGLSESCDGGLWPVLLLRTVSALPDCDRQLWLALAKAEQAYLLLQCGEAEPETLHAPLNETPGYCLPAFDLRLSYRGGDFLQANREVNRRLVQTAVDWLAPQPGQRVLDAFCGLGNFSLPLARRGAEVTGLEVSAAMVQAATANAVEHGLSNARFSVCNLQADDMRLPAGDWNAALLDPPRNGALALVNALIRKRVPTLAYVSCAPAMLARDAKCLKAAGYRLRRLLLADMFPQTAHAEALALFTR